MNTKSIALSLLIGAAASGATKAVEPAPVITTAAPASWSAPPASKNIIYSRQDIIPLQARVRFTTMIELPATESILDFVTGDKDFWIVSGTQNFAFVKPAKEGAKSNLNLITASGNVYSFTLTESGTVQPDLKVFVTLRDEGMLGAANGAPRFVAATAVDDWRQQVELARKAADEAAARVAAAERKAVVAKDKAVSEYPGTMRTDYKFKKDATFAVTSIYRDDKFTYIKAWPNETPAVYEVKDGKPSLINFQYKEGLYTLDKIVTDGYLAIGKKKLAFSEEGK